MPDKKPYGRGGYSAKIGKAIYPEDASRYGLYVYIEEPSEFLKHGAIGVAEIVRADTADGWKFRMRDINPEQLTKKKTNKRIYIWPQMLDALISAVSDLRQEAWGIATPGADEVSQSYKGRKNKADVSDGMKNLSEFSDAKTSQPEDEPIVPSDEDSIPF